MELMKPLWSFLQYKHRTDLSIHTRGLNVSHAVLRVEWVSLSLDAAHEMRCFASPNCHSGKFAK